MKTSVIYVDYKDKEGKWQKEWLSLCEGNILTLTEVSGGGKDLHAGIFVVHKSLPDFTLEPLQGKGYVMVVSGSKGNTKCSDDGFVCESGEAFPGNGDLTHLKPRFHMLVTSLLQCRDPQCRLAAWSEFHRYNEIDEYVISLSLLCQGYLALYAVFLNKEGFSGICTENYAYVRRALNAIGLVADDVVKEVSDTVQGLDSNPAKSMPDVEYWLSPFAGESFSCQEERAELERLRKGLEKECGSLREKFQRDNKGQSLDCPESGSLPLRINALVKAIEDDQVSDGNFVCVVARAYLELNLLLEDA
jgi:hypothetical protein